MLKKTLVLFLLSFYLYADDLTLDELFDLSIIELLEVEVTSSTKTKKNIEQAPSIVTVFNSDDIKKLGARTLSDVLFTVAGVQVQSRTNGRKEVWFRGVQSEFHNKILLLIDNVPIQNVFSDFAIDEALPLELVKKIEILKGPGAALYGANAFSGVISIYTYRPGELENSYSVRGEAGSQNTGLASFWVDEDLNYAKLLLEGKTYKSDGETPLHDRTGNVNNRSEEQELQYVRLKLASKNDKLLFSASAQSFDNTRVYKGYSVDNDREHKNFRINLEYKDNYLDGDASYYLNAYYTKTERFEIEDVYSLNNGARTGLDESFSFVDNVEHLGLSANTNIDISKHELLFGFEFKEEKLTDSYYTDNLTNEVKTFVQDPQYLNNEINTYSLFTQDTYTFNADMTQFTLGLRYDYTELFGDQLNYRLGLTHQFTNEIFSKLLFGTAYRTPSMHEYVRAPIGTPLPDVETMKTYEAQLGYKTKYTYLTLTGFYNTFKNLISRKNALLETGANLDEEQFGNLDDQEMYGLELESQYHMNSQWSGFTNASYLHTKSESTNTEIPLLATWTLVTGVDWTKDISIGSLLVHNDLVIYGDRKDWPDELWDPGQTQRYPGRDDDFSDAFLIWNTGIHYKLKQSNEHTLDVSLTVHNLLDEVYYTQSSSVPSASKEAFWDAQYDERHIRLSMSYSW